jgi:hypothetical protein
MVKTLETIAQENPCLTSRTVPPVEQAGKTYRVLIVGPPEYVVPVLEEAAKRMQKLGYYGSEVAYTYNKPLMKQTVQDDNIGVVVFFEPMNRGYRYFRWKHELESQVKRQGADMPAMYTAEKELTRKFGKFLKQYAPLKE